MFNFLTYKKFRSNKWANMSVASRLRALQMMEHIEAKKWNREELKIEDLDLGNNLLGRCDYSAKTIYINNQLLNTPNMQFMALLVLFHEGRHAYQYHVVSSNKNPWRFSKAYKWKKNMQNYIHYDGSDKFSYYSMQEVERDTNLYSLRRLQSLHFWFRNEDFYYRTLELKIKEMEKEKLLAKKELGLFYKWKVNRRINRKDS